MCGGGKEEGMEGGVSRGQGSSVCGGGIGEDREGWGVRRGRGEGRSERDKRERMVEEEN